MFSATTNLKFCAEYSRDRHLRYCGSRTRSRPRSCRACNAAKTKCSFEAPCSRCTKKGIECVYDASAAAERRALPRRSGESHRARARPRSRSSTSHANEALHADDGVNVDFTFTDDLAANDAQIRSVSGNGYPSFDLTSQRPSLNEFLTLDGLLAFEDTFPGQHQSSTEVSMAPYEKLDYQSQSWCGWMRRGVSLSMVTENIMVQSNSNDAAILRMERPLAQHNADLVIQSLRSFPAMMLRRETFPWYVHQHSQILSKPNTAALPEALSNCMSIAQMFALRTSETNPFLWRTIRAEYRRLSIVVRIVFTPYSSDSNH